MKSVKSLRPVLLFLAAATMLVLPAVASAAHPPPTQGVHMRPIGNPTWKPADFHLFSAPIAVAR